MIIFLVITASAFAGFLTEMTVSAIKIKADSTILVQTTNDGGVTILQFDMTGIAAETQKSMLTTLLTAKSAGNLIDVRHLGATVVDITIK